MAQDMDHDFKSQLIAFTSSVIRAAIAEYENEERLKLQQADLNDKINQTLETPSEVSGIKQGFAEQRTHHTQAEMELLDAHRIHRIGYGDVFNPTHYNYFNSLVTKKYEHQPLACKGSIISWLIPPENVLCQALDQNRPKKQKSDPRFIPDGTRQDKSLDVELTKSPSCDVNTKTSSFADRFLRTCASLCVNADRKVNTDDGRYRIIPLTATDHKPQTHEQQHVAYRSEIEEFFDWTDIEEPEKPTLPPFFGRLAEMPPLDSHATQSDEKVSRPRKFFSRCANALSSIFGCCRNKIVA